MMSKNPDQPELMLRAFWGAQLLWGLLTAVLVIIPLVVSGPLKDRVGISAIFLVLFGWIFINTSSQKFGIRSSNLIYTGYKLGLIPISKEVPLTNLNQIIFGRLGKANKQANTLGWPTPTNVTGGINLAKQFFLVLTNDHQTIAVPTQSYSKKGGEAFIAAIRKAGITVQLADD